ncbi:hypothetical protein Pd630_LPD00546 [Rhodococcus opacus PD630]|nr:hypothetical protein Pd630_LPD00546 [Rhodococcus opacus PD630]
MPFRQRDSRFYGPRGHSGSMTHEQAPDMTDFFSQEFWDDRYRSTTAV